MQLPRGITGFHDVNDPSLPRLSGVDIAAFRGHCFMAARMLGGQVHSVEGPAAMDNFARAVIEMPRGRIVILLNGHSLIVGFADGSAYEGAALQFIDEPAFVELFRSFGPYEVYSRQQLDLPVTPDVCQLLSRAEVKQIKSWKPQCIGEVVFNSWD